MDTKRSKCLAHPGRRQPDITPTLVYFSEVDCVVLTIIVMKIITSSMKIRKKGKSVTCDLE
ncbi:hypothetical protein ACTXT7_012119 [Hymenolepis weldensis]